MAMTYMLPQAFDKSLVHFELCRNHKISEIDVGSVRQIVGFLTVGVDVTDPVLTG